MDQVAAILVNEANIDQFDAIKAVIHTIRPDIIVAPYSQADAVASQLTQSSAAPAPTTTPTTPQVPAPIQVTPPVTQSFQTPDGAQVSGTFEKQPDGTWQQTSPEAPIFTVTPDNTQFFQTLEDKAAYALNPQTPDAVQPGEFGVEGYTAITPADNVATTPDPTAAATPPPLPEAEPANIFTQPVNHRGHAPSGHDNAARSAAEQARSRRS